MLIGDRGQNRQFVGFHEVISGLLVYISCHAQREVSLMLLPGERQPFSFYSPHCRLISSKSIARASVNPKRLS